MKKEELSTEEIDSLKSIGVIAQNWYAVSYDSTQTPLAIFSTKEDAEEWRDKNTATSIVEPWPLIIKDCRLNRLAST